MLTLRECVSPDLCVSCMKDRPYFEYFGINKFDGGPLVQLYNKMSKTKQGRVTVKTALSKLGIKKNAFMERMFSLLVILSMWKNSGCITHNWMVFNSCRTCNR